MENNNIPYDISKFKDSTYYFNIITRCNVFTSYPTVISWIISKYSEGNIIHCNENCNTFKPIIINTKNDLNLTILYSKHKIATLYNKNENDIIAFVCNNEKCFLKYYYCSSFFDTYSTTNPSLPHFNDYLRLYINPKIAFKNGGYCKNYQWDIINEENNKSTGYICNKCFVSDRVASGGGNNWDCSFCREIVYEDFVSPCAICDKRICNLEKCNEKLHCFVEKSDYTQWLTLKESCDKGNCYYFYICRECKNDKSKINEINKLLNEHKKHINSKEFSIKDLINCKINFYNL